MICLSFVQVRCLPTKVEVTSSFPEAIWSIGGKEMASGGVNDGDWGTVEKLQQRMENADLF